MNRETYCLLSLTITTPPDPQDEGLAPLSFTTWAFGPHGVGFTLLTWKRAHKVLAEHLTGYQVVTPTKKVEEKKMPKGRIVGKPNGVWLKPGERTPGRIHVRMHDNESTLQQT